MKEEGPVLSNGDCAISAQNPVQPPVSFLARMPQFKHTQISHVEKTGRKSLINMTPEEKKRHKSQLQKERREKRRKAKEDYLNTPEGQAADR